MTDEEWERRRELQCRHSGSKIVYRGCGMRDDADAVTWVTNPSAPIREERFRDLTNCQILNVLTCAIIATRMSYAFTIGKAGKGREIWKRVTLKLS